MSTLPGSTVGDDSYPIWVPTDDTPAIPLQALFIAQANSMVDQLQRVKGQLASVREHGDKFSPSGNWTVIVSTFKVYGEGFAYLLLELQRKGGTLSVPPDGNIFPNEVVGQLDSGWEPDAQSTLSSGSAGRLLAGYVLNSGEVKLAAANSGYDIHAGDHITLGGGFVLNTPKDSGV